MKLWGRCIVQKYRPSSNLGVIAPRGAHLQKCGIGLRHWKNQRRLSSCICYWSRLLLQQLHHKNNILVKPATWTHAICIKFQHNSLFTQQPISQNFSNISMLNFLVFLRGKQIQKRNSLKVLCGIPCQTWATHTRSRWTTYDMWQLRAVRVVDCQILNSTTQLVHALHIASQPATRTDKITQIE